MESTKYLSSLRKLPGKDKNYSQKDLKESSKHIRSDLSAIEVAIATELGMEYLYTSKNVQDSLFEAYEFQYPNLSEAKALYTKALEENEAGIDGLVSGIKGKLFELNLEEKLESLHPGYDFSISQNPTQPIWDLKGVNSDGQEILVQAKMGSADYANEVQEKMLNNPEVMFATSTEIQEEILDQSPELADQFVNINVSNTEFTTEVEGGLEQLLGNHGIDIPDGIDELLPFVGEILAGLKLIYELHKVNQDFSQVTITEKRRIRGLRAIMAVSRFGINSVLALVGGAAGGAAGGPLGGLGGGVLGLGAGMYFNKKIKPHLHEMALGLLSLSTDELFYLRNKLDIDDLGKQFRENRLSWCN